MDTLTKELVELGFEVCPHEPCIMRKFDTETGVEILVEVYVDDLKWATNDLEVLEGILNALHSRFPVTKILPPKGVDEYELSFDYLGMKYTNRWRKDGNSILTVHQTAYIDNICERLDITKRYDGDMERVGVTPREYATPLPKHSGGPNDSLKSVYDKNKTHHAETERWAARHSYPAIIGSLIHAMVHTRSYSTIYLAFTVPTYDRSLRRYATWR